ncbi:MAG: hypothetical protein KatS3mg051_1165 [Anaerolineae bacterium]|nr:MAG: hypothetical protein KatS3mg051_1053 [Anaerolineae bacterium]GIV81811.1 MAG: hypothetical protein KatS3mg051_1165 [Anaerolineae bacterium]
MATKRAAMDLSDYPEEYHAALRLLIPLWRGLDGAYKQRYARNIWEQFESNIRAAAYTSSLSRFINSLCSKLQVYVTNDALADVVESVGIENERALLRQLREEATTLVLMVRLENEKRKAEWRQRWQEEHDAMADGTETTETGGLFE